MRHPLIFYYGHPAALYVNKLRVAGLLRAPLNPYFEVIFETGVDEMSWDDMSKNEMPWPSVAEVHAYRAAVYRAVSELIGGLSDEQCAGITPRSDLWALVLAMEHERIHVETSSVLITELPLQYVAFPAGQLPPYHTLSASSPETPVRGVDYPSNELVSVPASRVKLGRPAAASPPTFGWDNEFGAREYELPAFCATECKVSNGEFWEFVRDGGYAKPQYWSKAGWEWRAFRNAKWPQFWVLAGPQGLHRFDLRLLCDVVPMQWAWPVAVNYHEAHAFAAWRSERVGRACRVMTELEHNAIRDEAEAADRVATYSGARRMVDETGVNANWSHASMSPVKAAAPNAKGFYDVFGNAWEWTSCFFSPLTGFQVHSLYEDFSTPCFDGLHHVIQGSSFASSGNEASAHSRYHFRPHFLQHASFRVVEGGEGAGEEPLHSDTDAPGPYVGEYPFRRSALGRQQDQDRRLQRADPLPPLLDRSFGRLPSSVGGMPALRNMAAEAYTLLTPRALHDANVLEVGCGAGGLALLLAPGVRSVLGIDHSAEAVAAAKAAVSSGMARYSLPGGVEGRPDVQVDCPLLLGVDGGNGSAGQTPVRIDFRAADPTCLPAELHGFDMVVLNDVLDSVPSPNAVLGRLGGSRGLVRPGGVLLVASAYQFQAHRTPRDLWLDGASALAQRLATDFEHTVEVPNDVPLTLLWRETATDLRGKLLTVSVFRRKASS